MSKTPSRFSLELAHVWRKLTGHHGRAQRLAKVQFNAALARLTATDIVIDLGANAGEFTEPMAATGAQVYAFEPDPHAQSLLRVKVGHLDNVTIVPAAAGVETGTAKLYRKGGFDREPDRASKSSSLYAEKTNVDTNATLEIDIVDFPKFLADLNHPIALIKMDIEGGEVPLMEALFAAADRLDIAEIYVETHERKLPHLANRTKALRVLSRDMGTPRVNWDWH